MDCLTSKLNLKNSLLNYPQTAKKRSRDMQVRTVRTNGVLENENKTKEEIKKVYSSSVAINLPKTVLKNRAASEGPIVLRDITNNRFLEEDGKGKCRSLRKKNEVARERWKLLAKALLKPKKASSKSIKFKDISVRRFTSFGLITPNKLDKLEKVDDCWLKYFTKIRNNTYLIEIHHLDQKLTPKELIGFNNTGNICIWPSEEVLTFYIISNVQWFEGREVLEVGGGMTCLAGLMLAKYGKVKQVDLTDGNVISVENVEKIIGRNKLDKSTTTSFHLDWVDHRRLTRKYDVVLSSDCLFFDETRSDLVETIWNSLRDDGVALVMAPKRGNTLDYFVKIATERGFYCIIQTCYEQTVWQQHLKFKESCLEYDEDLHYPILLLLTKSSRSVPYLLFSSTR